MDRAERRRQARSGWKPGEVLPPAGTGYPKVLFLWQCDEGCHWNIAGAPFGRAKHATTIMAVLALWVDDATGFMPGVSALSGDPWCLTIACDDPQHRIFVPNDVVPLGADDVDINDLPEMAEPLLTLLDEGFRLLHADRRYEIFRTTDRRLFLSAPLEVLEAFDR